MKTDSVIALIDEAKSMMFEQFNLLPKDIENPDVYWHNAWKMKINRAIPYEGYYAIFRYVDDNIKKGRTTITLE